MERRVALATPTSPTMILAEPYVAHSFSSPSSQSARSNRRVTSAARMSCTMILAEPCCALFIQRSFTKGLLYKAHSNSSRIVVIEPLGHASRAGSFLRKAVRNQLRGISACVTHVKREVTMTDKVLGDEHRRRQIAASKKRKKPVTNAKALCRLEQTSSTTPENQR